MKNQSKRQGNIVALRAKKNQEQAIDVAAEKAQILAEVEAARAKRPASWDVKLLVRQASKESHRAKKFKEIVEDESNE